MRNSPDTCAPDNSLKRMKWKLIKLRRELDKFPVPVSDVHTPPSVNDGKERQKMGTAQ